jgi:hypothetical protein
MLKRLGLLSVLPKCLTLSALSGGRVVANQMAHKIPLELVGQVFFTTLIIFEGQGINVILGMS